MMSPFVLFCSDYCHGSDNQQQQRHEWRLLNSSNEKKDTIIICNNCLFLKQILSAFPISASPFENGACFYQEECPAWLNTGCLHGMVHFQLNSACCKCCNGLSMIIMDYPPPILTNDILNDCPIETLKTIQIYISNLIQNNTRAINLENKIFIEKVLRPYPSSYEIIGYRNVNL